MERPDLLDPAIDLYTSSVPAEQQKGSPQTMVGIDPLAPEPHRVEPITIAHLMHLAQDDFAKFAFRIIDHPALVIPHHRLVVFRIRRCPCQARLAWITRSREVSPCGRHLLRQRLCLGRVAGALFAAFRIVKAEGKLGRMPCAGIFQHWRLPGEVIRIHRSGFQVMLQLRHAHYVIADRYSVQNAPATTHI